MKSISASLATDLASQYLTTATLWKATLTNGTVLGFTDHDQDITYGGLVYTASTGFSRTAIQTTETLGVDNLEVRGLLSSPAITEDALLSGLWDYARIDLMLINWADTSHGVLQLPSGQLGQVTRQRDAFTAELRGLSQLLQQRIGDVYTPGCTADLGDSRCTVNLASITVSGTVGSVASNRIITDVSRVEGNGYFTYGLLTFTSGLNSGLAMEVKAYTTGQIELAAQMYYAISPGDTYTVYPGCDKSRATCVSKFGNIVNFRGFPDLPGIDQLTKVPTT